MFKFIPTVVVVSSLLFNGHCLEKSKFDLPERLNNKIVYEILDEGLGQYERVNIARGTPELYPPLFLNEALSKVSLSKNLSIHEYMPSEGYAGLREEIALLYSPLINQPLSMSENVVITLGVTQGIHLSISSNTEPGDEWIILEPAFEDYFVNINMAGGIVKAVQLTSKSSDGKLSSSDFVFDKEEMRNAFNSKTKGIILNNPHNPTGKSFTKEELLFIGELAVKWNAIIVCDEVYEWINYDSTEHIRIASLGERIFNQTITLSSVSKSFFASGFRVGWAYGPSKLIGNMKTEIPYLNYAGNSYAQVAIAEGIRKIRNEMGRPDVFLEKHVKFLKQKRDFALKMLNDIGMKTVFPEAGFFIYMNWTNFESKITNLDREAGPSRDWKFISWLIKNTGVLFYPGTGLYHDGNKIGEDYVRICFAKGNDKLNEAALLLKQLKIQ